MSEYQRYEFMTSDRPLTQKELNAVNDLSSHIEASSTHAVIEYHWGNFKHDPVEVLYEFFDGFLYWANWGTPHLALRFPHGILPANLIDGYDFDDFVTFMKHRDYDILDIHFSEMESSGDWMEYELGSLIPIREELMKGDLRALYIAWLAAQQIIGDYDDEEEEEEIEGNAPPVPPAFDTLTEAQQALAELLQVPQELLVAAARHSSKAAPTSGDDFAAWIKLLTPDQRDGYLLRLAHNEAGLNHLLARDLRKLGKGKTKAAPSTAEHVTYATLQAESKAIQTQLAREKLEQERLAHLQELQAIYDHQDDYWHRVDVQLVRGSGAGYGEAVDLLVKLREATTHFGATPAFQARFRTWIQPHMRRAAFLKRLHDQNFTLPQP